jgi:prepilin-type N-terminal cleavage/methylation domain-containing protein
MIRIQQRVRAHRRGYTLLEIMFAILILGVGMAAVASLFPFAAHIQQNTMFEVRNQQTQTNIVGLVHAHGFSREMLDRPAGLSFDPTAPMPVYPTELNKLTPAMLDLAYTLPDRSYPSNVGTDTDANSILDADFDKRSIFWEPLFVKRDDKWRIMVVIMRRRAKGVVPTLERVTVTLKAAGTDRDYLFDPNVWVTGPVAAMNALRVGDKVIDQLGNVRDVLEKAYDDIGGAGQNSIPFAVKVSGDLPSAIANWTFWHISQNGATHSGEILDVLILGEEVLK